MAAVQSNAYSESLQNPVEFNGDLSQALQAIAGDDSALGLASKAILEGKSSISTTPAYAIFGAGSEIAIRSELVRIVVGAPMPSSYLVIRLSIDTANVSIEQVHSLRTTIKSFTDQIPQDVWEALADDEKKLIISMAGLGTLHLDQNQVDLEVKESLCQVLDLGQCYEANPASANTNSSQSGSTVEPSVDQVAIENKLDRIIKAIESQSDSDAVMKEANQVEENLDSEIKEAGNISDGVASPSHGISQKTPSRLRYPSLYTWETWPHHDEELQKSSRLFQNAWVEMSYESANPYLPRTRRVFNWDGVQIARQRRIGSQWPMFPGNLN